MTLDALSCGVRCDVFTKALTGAAQSVAGHARPTAGPRVYFANHTSHGDFVLIWTVLPPACARATRPVAGADYWRKRRAAPLRRRARCSARC